MKKVIPVKAWWIAVIVAVATVPAGVQTRDARLFLFASGQDGKPVTDLTANEITVRDRGIEVRPSELRKGLGNIRIVILVDNSDAVIASLPAIKRGLVALVAGAPQGARIAVVTVGGPPHIRSELLGDRVQTRRVVGSLYGEIGAGTEVARAIVESEAHFFQGSDDWPVMVIIASDAAENTAGVKQPDFDAAQGHLLEAGGTVHAIVLTGSANNSGGAAVLHAMTHNLCDTSKGMCLDVSSSRAIAAAMSRIVQRMNVDADRASSAYELRYRGTTPTGTIEVGTSRLGVSLIPSALRVP